METPVIFASIEDVEALFRPLSDRERFRTGNLLEVVSGLLRQAAADVGKDLDEMVAASASYAAVVKVVAVDVVSRILRQNTTSEAMVQESQSAMGYSWSGTYAIPGGGVAGGIMNNDLKRLGLVKKQRCGVIEFYEQPD